MVYIYPSLGNSHSMKRYLEGVLEGLDFHKIPFEIVKPPGSGAKAKYLQYPRMVWSRRKKKGHHLIISERYAHLVPFMAANSIVVCHDMHTLYPESQTQIIHKKLYLFFLNCMRRARQVVCVSQHTLSDLVKMSPRFQSHMSIRVVENGIENFWADLTKVKEEAVIEYSWVKLFREKKVLLSVGTDAWYKNSEWSLRLLASLDEHYHLLRIGVFNEKNLKLIEKLNISERITTSEFVHDSALKFCYQNAKALLFPSISEGYGWPALEASLSGCQVISDGCGATSEIFKDGKGLVPLDRAREVLLNADEQAASSEPQFNLWHDQVKLLLNENNF